MMALLSAWEAHVLPLMRPICHREAYSSCLHTYAYIEEDRLVIVIFRDQFVVDGVFCEFIQDQAAGSFRVQFSVVWEV